MGRRGWAGSVGFDLALALVAEAVSRSLSAVPVIRRELLATAGHPQAEQSEQTPRPAGRPRY